MRLFEQDNLILYYSNFQILEPSDPSQRAGMLVVMKGKSWCPGDTKNEQNVDSVGRGPNAELSELCLGFAYKRIACM